MKVLVVGVNGFIGRAVATCCADRRLGVFGLSRSAVPRHRIRGTYLAGDRNSRHVVRDIVIARGIDAVIDVLAMTLADTQALISDLEGHIAQYVLLSSSDVYRNYELLQRKAAGKPILGSIDESSALRETRYPYRSHPPRDAHDPNRYLDEYDKIPIEDAVRGLKTTWTILRLPMVYGPGDRQRRFRWAIRHMADNDEPLVIPRQWAAWTTTYGYIDDVAAGIALVLGHDSAANRVFNIGERVPVTQIEWARRIAAVMAWHHEIEAADVSSELARQAGSLDLEVPFKVDSARIRQELGYTESVSIGDSLYQTIADELSRA